MLKNYAGTWACRDMARKMLKNYAGTWTCSDMVGKNVEKLCWHRDNKNIIENIWKICVFAALRNCSVLAFPIVLLFWAGV